MNSSDFPWQQVRALLFEHLRLKHNGSFAEAFEGVVALASARGLCLQMRELDHNARTNVGELVRQLLWQLLVQQVLVFGLDEGNPNWPWYRLTAHGEKVVSNQGAQPYDPDGFLEEFRSRNPTIDKVVLEYTEEAVRAFNANCPKAAAVMLGGASEKLILLLYESFKNGIVDQTKKNSFEKMSNTTWSLLYTIPRL